MKLKMEVTSDFTDRFNEVIKKFKNDSVLVGIPEDKSQRDEQGDPINNAALLAINEFGSPVNNIPSRHPMRTGIKNAQEPIAEEFKKAASSALSKGPSAIDQYYERAGIIASNAVKKAINSQEDMDPPSEATLRGRKSKGFSGTKALIVTGQMRNAITYVVKRSI